MDLTAFLSQNKIKQDNIKYVASKSFVGKDGKPIEWELRAIPTEENDALKKLCTRKVKSLKGQLIPETDTDLYIGKLSAACVVFPDLKDANLQDSYKVMGEDLLLKKMLSLGEYTALTTKIAEINGFDDTMDGAIEEAKN